MGDSFLVSTKIEVRADLIDSRVDGDSEREDGYVREEADRTLKLPRVDLFLTSSFSQDLLSFSSPRTVP